MDRTADFERSLEDYLETLGEVESQKPNLLNARAEALQGHDFGDKPPFGESYDFDDLSADDASKIFLGLSDVNLARTIFVKEKLVPILLKLNDVLGLNDTKAYVHLGLPRDWDKGVDSVEAFYFDKLDPKYSKPEDSFVVSLNGRTNMSTPLYIDYQAYKRDIDFAGSLFHQYDSMYGSSILVRAAHIDYEAQWNTLMWTFGVEEKRIEDIDLDQLDPELAQKLFDASLAARDVILDKDFFLRRALSNHVEGR